MSKEEFEKYLKGFFGWTSHTERSTESWLYSLEDWAKMSRASERAKERKPDPK